MRYPYGAEPQTTARIDPVCGMTVDEATPHRFRDARGREQLFCSAVCSATFLQASTASDRPDAGEPRPARGSERRPGVLTLLYVASCPGFPLLARRLRAAIAQSSIDRLLVRARTVRQGEPPVTGFAGSPTLLVNGVDPFPVPAVAAGLGCRHYLTEAGLDASPSIAQLVTALRSQFS